MYRGNSGSDFVFLEPLKRIQVEGFAMFAEPQLLFGNLDELCSVSLDAQKKKKTKFTGLH